MKKYILLLLGTLGLSMQLSAASGYFQNDPNAQTSSQNNTYYGATATQGSNFADEDRRLADRIRDRLKGWFSNGYADLVTIDVNNGDVTIRGVVAKIDDKNEIERRVREIEGVRRLNSQIAVQGSTRDFSSGSTLNSLDRASTMTASPNSKFPQDRAITTSDQQLNKAIRDKISNGFFFTYYNDIELDTENGHVLLQGVVNSREEEQKLISDIQNIGGILSVNSNLRVTS